uniref:TctD transcriptional regulator n=1 Tax=Kumanoa americana TaxID=1196377 RepID=A0A1C9CGS3_9FLOR|nr:hypothetical protein Kuma_147 [Kumanoa americana]AOM67581.1 hypothetical protein Kuma_147 [Kumanoa americana]
MAKHILLVDDDNSMRKSLALYLSNQGFMVTTCRDVTTAYLSFQKQIPDVVISDILMPKINGYKFIQLLKKKIMYSHIIFIFLTVKGMTQDRIFGYKLGCHAYLTKPFDPEELLWIIKSLLATLSIKDTILSDLLSQRSVFLYNLHSSELTYREKTILNLVLKGMMNKEIARELALSIRNVEKYVSRLLSKTGTRNRTELVQYFYRLYCKSIKGE